MIYPKVKVLLLSKKVYYRTLFSRLSLHNNWLYFFLKGIRSSFFASYISFCLPQFYFLVIFKFHSFHSYFRKIFCNKLPLLYFFFIGVCLFKTLMLTSQIFSNPRWLLTKVSPFNTCSANPTKWSNTSAVAEEFFAKLTILWNWCLKG